MDLSTEVSLAGNTALFDLTGKVVIVTGSTKGIGRAMVEGLAGAGAAVVVSSRRQDLCDVVAEEVRGSTGADVMALACHVGDWDAIPAFVDAVVARFGRVDVLVNNAGVVLVKPFDQITWEEFQRTLQVNLGGHFLLIKHVLPFMRKQKNGVIVNMGSVSGHVGQIDHVMYGATKGAIIAMTRALAWELAPDHIRVNSISPGSVDTPMLRSDIDLEAKRTGASFGQVKKEREAEQAFKRWAEPAEIAEPIYFLASEGASFVTGSDWLVDCGWVAR
jgi:NAD(P)-dependent dehydrogenase (short-subunit alcohol dehydrogenase family)